MATDLPRFSITLDEVTAKQVGLYQDARGFSTRSGAIQELIRIGLAHQEDQGIIQKTKRLPSLSKGALAVARAYDRYLDDYDRKIIRLLTAYSRARLEDQILEQAPPNERTPEEDFADMLDDDLDEE